MILSITEPVCPKSSGTAPRTAAKDYITNALVYYKCTSNLSPSLRTKPDSSLRIACILHCSIQVNVNVHVVVRVCILILKDFLLGNQQMSVKDSVVIFSDVPSLRPRYHVICDIPHV